ncbi:MAG TPA: S-methyl-5'-thioadenosine phosphorylase [Patescibacteria group bacterium]|nr:S-methyl-5'-thioadenosine phosphorylase [Patescibacteria group bacterium]
MKIGIIGGSGLDDPQILENYQTIKSKTSYGWPSDDLIVGKIKNIEVVILPRHGKNHSIMPTMVPYRANVEALKDQGCQAILATTACGSLQENIRPGEFVFLDQFIDFTKHRNLTYHEKKVVHTPMAEPFDRKLRKKLILSAKELDLKFHDNGTAITIEGPRFSTRAESLMFQKLGGQVINMSTVPEVILANELKIPYQSIAMVTDFDCWKKNEKFVTWELIVDRMNNNVDKVRNLLLKTVKNWNKENCG